MDSSFLTFSPKIASRKKSSSNVVSKTAKSRLLKLNLLPLQDTCSSPSNLYNSKNNCRKSFNSNNKSNSTEALDESIVFLCEEVKNDKYSSSCSPQLASRELRTSIKYPTLSSKHVKGKDLQNSEHDKFDEIRNWLNELHHAHERKKQIPMWTDSPSSVIESSSNSNKSISNPNDSTCIVPETSSDESVLRESQKEKQNQINAKLDKKFRGGDSNQIKSGRGNDGKMSQCSVLSASVSVVKHTSYLSKSSGSEVSCDIVAETSHSSSTKLEVDEKCQSLTGSEVNKKSQKCNLNWRECGNSSDDSWQPTRRKRVGVILIDNESDGETSSGSYANANKKPTAHSSNNCSGSSGKQNVHKNRRFTCVDITSSDESNASSGKISSKSEGGKCRSSLESDNSIVSLSSTERIVSKVYGKSWDAKTVLTPILRKKEELPVKKKCSEEDTASVEDLLSQFYGNIWDKEKVLTPLVNKRNNVKVKGKENTPPDRGKKRIINKKIEKTTSETKTPRTQISTPKSIITSRRGLKSLKTLDELSFLKSLSASPSPLRCNPRAMLFKKEFRKYKEALCDELFKLYNSEVFENKLPATLKIEWSLRMYTTAGYCKQQSILRPDGKIRLAVIQLSSKVCDSADRVRDTLIHELCHAAAWILDGYRGGHGMQWRAWARKAMRRFPELPQITVCHAYKIQTKYIYKCKSCGYSIGRHSKSLDLSRKRCGLCFGEFELLVNAKPRTAKTGLTSTPRIPRAANGFALFVKENYKTVKERNNGLKHAEIMKLLGKQFSGMKVGSDQQA